MKEELQPQSMEDAEFGRAPSLTVFGALFLIGVGVGFVWLVAAGVAVAMWMNK